MATFLVIFMGKNINSVKEISIMDFVNFLAFGKNNEKQVT